jgi:hypothetical protein
MQVLPKIKEEYLGKYNIGYENDSCLLDTTSTKAEKAYF